MAGLLTILPAIGRGGRSMAAAVQPAPTPPPPFPENVTVTIAGPEGDTLDRWARLILPALQQTLPGGTRLRGVPAGTADGVTGANQFQARAAPDGASLLLLPGSAALAWLAGEPRARFDAGNWVSVIAGVAPGMVILRGGAASLETRRSIRVATTSPASADLAALLAIELLGCQPVAVRGLKDEAAVLDAMAKGDIDAALLRGARARELATTLAAGTGAAGTGARPAFTLGQVGVDGAYARDPLFPDLPHLTEQYALLRGAPPAGLLFDAWRAVAAATQLEFAAALPRLTPAAVVALWRRAGGEAANAPAVRQEALGKGVQVQEGSEAAASVAAIAAESAALLELRRWMAERFDWRPT